MKFPHHIIESIFFEIIELATTVRKTSGKTVLRGRCPVCGDSQTHKYKTRFYCLEGPKHWAVICHNCGLSMSFLPFLKEHFPDKANMLTMSCFDMIKSGEMFSRSKKFYKEEKIKPNQRIHNYLTAYFHRNCLKLDEKCEDPDKEKLRKYALSCMLKRKIPKYYIKQFFFCFRGLYNWRIIIPFIDGHGCYYNFQARDIHPHPDEKRLDKKYIFANFRDIELPSDKIYRQYQVSKTRTVYICEGIIDCMHIENAISLCNANVTGDKAELIRKEYPDRVWILDSPWTDKTGYERTVKLLEMGEKCFIIPENINGVVVKDINDIAKALNTETIKHDYINSNVISGKIAIMKLKTMKVGYKK